MTYYEEVQAHLKNPSPLNLRQRRRKVAIIGAALSGVSQTPFDEDEWDVWGCNYLFMSCRDKEGRFRADAWFELHPHTIPPQQQYEVEAMAACPVPLYTIGSVPWCPTGVPFPLEILLAQPWCFPYFSCTFAYQIALAIYLGYESIGLFGVELTAGRELIMERPCVSFWLGLASGRGHRVILPETSTLLWHPHLYGFNYDAEKKYGEQHMEDVLQDLNLRADYERR